MSVHTRYLQRPILRFAFVLVVLMGMIVLGGGYTPAITLAQEPTPTAPAPEVIGAVSGSVVNGSAGAAVPADLNLELHIVDASMNESVRQTTVTADGTFRFADVPMRAENTYIVSTRHQTRLFSSDFVKGDPAQPELTLTLTIYELTDDTSVIQITSFITQALANENGLQVAAMIRFKNTSDRLFVTKEQVSETQFTSIKLVLPFGAEIMGFADSSDRFVVGADGRTVNDTLPVSPGADHVIHVVYLMPYNPTGTVLEQTLPYPLVGSAELYARPTTLTVKAEAGGTPLVGRGVVDRSGSPYQGFGGSTGLPAAGVLRYAFSGAAEVSNNSGSSAGSSGGAGVSSTQSGGLPRELIVGILVGGGIGLIVVGAGLMLRERRMTKNQTVSDSDPETLLAEAESIALAALQERGETPPVTTSTPVPVDPQKVLVEAELIALEALFDARKITRKEYESRKAVLTRHASGK